MLIAVEGIDGSGKTTQAKLLADFLKTKTTKQIINTREPGGTLISEKIRDILLDHNLNDHLTELFLYVAARREHFITTIQPNVDQGNIVICDRFIASTIAYQGFGFGIDINIIQQLHDIILPHDYSPNITFILDVDVRIALDRAQKTDNDQKYENTLSKSFYERTRNGFFHFSQQEHCYLINANNEIQNIHDGIKNIISDYL